MSGAICGGSPYLWKVEVDPVKRWCFGERRHVGGSWELRGAWEKDTMATLEDGTPDPVMMWEPVWIYRCAGCQDDRRSGGFYNADGWE